MRLWLVGCILVVEVITIAWPAEVAASPEGIQQIDSYLQPLAEKACALSLGVIRDKTITPRQAAPIFQDIAGQLDYIMAWAIANNLLDLSYPKEQYYFMYRRAFADFVWCSYFFDSADNLLCGQAAVFLLQISTEYSKLYTATPY
jgi:hypothetical protein